MNRRLVGIAVAGFCTFLNLYAPQSLLPTLSGAFGASAGQTGLAITVSLLAVASMAPFVGGISDAFGRRRLIVPAAFLLVIPTALSGLAPTLDMLLLCRFAQGLLLPFIFTVTVAYVADECPGAEGVRATGIYSVGTIVGGFSGRFIAGWVGNFLGWRASFAVLTALTLTAAMILAWCLPAERQFRPVRSLRHSVVSFAVQARNRQVIATCGVGFAVLFSTVGAFTYANLLLAAPPYHMGPAALGSVFVTYLAGAVVTPPAARLTVRLGRRRMALLAGVVSAVGLGLTLLPSLPAILVGLAVLTIGIFVEQMLSIGYVAVAAEGARSTAVGLYVTCYYLGGSVGGILPASVWAHYGWPGCVALILLVQVAAVVITAVVWPRQTALR